MPNDWMTVSSEIGRMVVKGKNTVCTILPTQTIMPGKRSTIQKNGHHRPIHSGQHRSITRNHCKSFTCNQYKTSQSLVTPPGQPLSHHSIKFQKKKTKVITQTLREHKRTSPSAGPEETNETPTTNFFDRENTITHIFQRMVRTRYGNNREYVIVRCGSCS